MGNKQRFGPGESVQDIRKGGELMGDEDDVEGHGSKQLRASDEDDVEGHGSKQLRASDEDDVEGHRTRQLR
jgi:hypothetical protein